MVYLLIRILTARARPHALKRNYDKVMPLARNYNNNGTH